MHSASSRPARRYSIVGSLMSRSVCVPSSLPQKPADGNHNPGKFTERLYIGRSPAVAPASPARGSSADQEIGPCRTWARRAKPQQDGGSAMAIELYDLSVANYLQTLGAVVGFLEKGLAHFTATHVDLDEIVETRLVPD